VLGDLFVVGQIPQLLEVQFHRVLNEPADFQAVVGEVGVVKCLVFIGLRVLAVVPKVGRNVGLGVLAGLRVEVLEESLHRPDNGHPRDRAAWMLSTELTERMRVESAGDIPRPVRRAAGAAMKTVKK
jgi:hypothetical protein